MYLSHALSIHHTVYPYTKSIHHTITPYTILVLRYYQRAEYDHNKPVLKKVSNEAKELVSSMLRVDPLTRLSASECLLHPWLSGRCHTAEMLTPLPEVQEMVRGRLERKRKKTANPVVSSS
ncbi:hypothetical protein EON64_03405 [archaeon]|nr:MAG: hypothetical protein EON64_03405 [archaeon]